MCKKVASGKLKSSSNYSVDEHEKYATVDGDNAEVQIAAEVYNDNVNVHGKELIEGSKTRAENSVKESYASDTTLPVKLT